MQQVGFFSEYNLENFKQELFHLLHVRSYILQVGVCFLQVSYKSRKMFPDKSSVLLWTQDVSEKFMLNKKYKFQRQMQTFQV